MVLKLAVMHVLHTLNLEAQAWLRSNPFSVFLLRNEAIGTVWQQ